MRVYDRSSVPRSVLVTSSQIVSNGPSLIVGVAISGTGSNPDAQIYDGKNANGLMKLHLDCLQYTGWSPNIQPGVECLTGIYVVVDAATTYVLVQYYPANEVESKA